MSYGGIEVYMDLDTVKSLLMREGFYDPGILQKRKEGQEFGLVKPINELIEVHVRGYKDNTLDAEVELSREYLEHLSTGSSPSYGFLIDILRKYNIPYSVIKPLPSDPEYISIPKTLTKWKPLVICGIGIVILGLSLWFSLKDKNY
ncbi:MAG: hypothetical protein QXP36_01815 [Conexivisphaerales archaeon]